MLSAAVSLLEGDESTAKFIEFIGAAAVHHGV
jgi:hypothetical protein